MKKRISGLKKVIWYVMYLFCMVVLLGFINRLGIIGYVNFSNFPNPFGIISAIFQDYTLLIKNVIVTFIRVIQGFFIGSVLGVLGGIIASLNKKTDMLINPIMDVLRPVPNAAWLPIAILVFTKSDISLRFILTMSSLFPVYINTRYGVLKIDKEYMELSKVLNLNMFHRVYEIFFKGALYDIFVGLQLGMSGTWLAVIVAEMVSGKTGIGYYIWLNYTLINADKVFAGVVIISVCGMVSCKLVSLIGKATIKWR